jgi:coenzyme F420-reducing hydrogenase delta subunit
MCSGRVDLEFILRAFSNGQDGVFIGGCRLGECNYITHGNYDALGNVYLCKKIMEHLGLNPERIMIDFMSSAEGTHFAETVNGFSNKVKSLGAMGESEGLDKDALKLKLEAARKIVPYIRLVERERLRAPAKSKDLYHDFFTSDEFNRLFHESIGDNLVVSQITSLLKERPLSTGDIAETLGLNPSDVSRHMKTSSRHGLVKYDVSEKLYTLS